MKIKGIDQFRQKIPSFSGKKIFVLPVYFISVMLVSIMVIIGFDSMPGVAISTGTDSIMLAFFPLVGELIVGIIGFVMVYQMWYWRDRLKSRYGQLSYQRIFLVGFAGVLCVLSLSINQFIPYWSFSPSFWANSPLRFLTLPLEAYAHVAGPEVFWGRIALAVFFSIVGIGMMIRSVQTFGIDYMTVVYLYFPEESKMQYHEIYSVLRHPMYAGALTFGLGGMFFTFTAYSIILFIVYLIGFYIHVHFVEEKELISRFGASYQQYMKKVPAFFVNPTKTGTLFGFLLREPSRDIETK
jgi:protein-S-isoprenylcysteine O-methyltransferase Ste14